MLSFASEFPVDRKQDSTEFLQAVRRWILGSPHTRLISEDLANIEKGSEPVVKIANETVEVLKFTSTKESSAAVKYTKNEDRLEWVTTITFSRQESNSWIGIRVSCESCHPSVQLPIAKKPVAIKILLDQLGGGQDGPLTVKPVPLFLENSDVDTAAKCISGTAGCHLPIVYISAEFQGGYSVDAMALARELSGMAHVIVEPNRPF